LLSDPNPSVEVIANNFEIVRRGEILQIFPGCIVVPIFGKEILHDFNKLKLGSLVEWLLVRVLDDIETVRPQCLVARVLLQKIIRPIQVASMSGRSKVLEDPFAIAPGLGILEVFCEDLIHYLELFVVERLASRATFREPAVSFTFSARISCDYLGAILS
jgi:hypothetical protein